MGVCYSISARLLYEKADTVIKAFEKALSNVNLADHNVPIWVDPAINDPIERYMKALLTDAAHLEDGIWIADFEGRFYWEVVLQQVFEYILEFCDVGSYVEISPDADIYWIKTIAPRKTEYYYE